MKGKIIQLLLSCLFWLSLLFLSGDLKKIIEKLKQKLPEDNGDVILSDVRFSSDGTKQSLSFTAHNGTGDEICFDSSYDLYYIDGASQILLSEKTEGYVVTSDYIPAGESRYVTLDLTERFDRLTVGKYRFSKTFGVHAKEFDFSVDA